MGGGHQGSSGRGCGSRLKAGGPYNTPDRATFYGGGAKGYTDYPALGTV
ncbi:hypothetical protein ACIGJO_00370 [Streptomyces sp. NPDC079020]